MKAADLVRIDGSLGEGGGQILRTSLALSIITGRPFSVSRIRANRSKPGLAKQHLTAVLAAAELCGGRPSGASLRSQKLHFQPGPVAAGEYSFDVGTAGSTTLVLQTVLPPLLMCDASSRVKIRGGTHNPMAPPVEFLQRVFAPQLAAMGAKLEIELIRPGFYPKGGGQIEAVITPPHNWTRVSLCRSHPPQVTAAICALAKLPQHIADRELAVLADAFALTDQQLQTVELTRSSSPGNVLYAECSDGKVTELHSVCGEKGIPAEEVARKLVAEVETYLQADAPVGPHLADQLLVPLAIGGGGEFDCGELTPHATTNMEVIRKFVDADFSVEQLEGTNRVRVTPGSLR